MGLSLLGQPGLEVFTRSFNRLLDLCEGHLPLREILESGDELRETEKTQPALFCLEVALYRQWEAWGVKPEILIGHSIGELAAAHVAGVMTLGEAVQLVCARGRLMTELARPGGAMAALRLSEGKVLQILEGLGLELEIASVNSEHHTVVSGEKEAIEELLGQCGEKAKYLRVSHAFHSRHMEPMLESFREIASQFDYGKPTIPLVSTLTGERLETIDADYWVKQLRHTVRFGKATKLVQELGVTTFLECGPGASLSPLVDNGISSLSRKEDEFLALMRAVGKLWESHQELDWEVFFAPFEPRVVELPTYAFQRERYWPVPLAEEETVLRWCYEHRWQPADKASKAQDYEELWLVVPETLGEKLARASGQDCRVLSFEEVLDEELPARTCVVYSPEPGGSWSRSLEQLLELSQKLKAQPFEGSLWVLTPQTISLGESDPPGSGLLQSLWGFGRSLSLEEPRLLGGLVDLPSEVTTEELETVWPYLLQETPCEDELVLREGNLWSRRLQRTELDEGKTWRPEGKILIAGGSGYLGQLLTNWLKKQGAEDLLLVSRTGLFPCDVTDEAAVRSLLASNEDIKHIFHLAGVESRGRLQELSKAELRRVMAAKVEGAWNLHRVSQEMGLPLESFVMYGSIAGFWGSGGQLGYSAANAALTGLMEVRRSLGLAGTVVHWGPWAKGGMVSPERAEYLRRRGILEMEPEQAHRALFKILASDLFSIVVSKMDWKPFAESLSSARPRPLLSEISMISPADYSQPVVDSTSKITDELARLEEDERLPWLVEFVRREVAEVLGLGSVEKIPPERPIQELGLDSLMAIELRNRLMEKCELRLPTTLVYDYPEPEGVACFLLEEMSGFRRWSNDEVHRKLRSVSIEALRESGILEAFMAIPEGLVEEADELRQQISEAGEDELMGLAERLLGDRSTLSSE